MQSITVFALKQKLSSGEDIQLVDVREAYEHDHFNIGGTLVPLGELLQHTGLIEKEKPVILYCQKGIRSQIAIQRLCGKYPYQNLFNLIGGMDAWRKHIAD